VSGGSEPRAEERRIPLSLLPRSRNRIFALAISYFRLVLLQRTRRPRACFRFRFLSRAWCDLSRVCDLSGSGSGGARPIS